MKIRKEQMDSFSRGLEDAFVKRMVDHLRIDLHRQVRGQGLKESDLEPLVRRSMKESEQFGVIYQDDIERYIECKVILGPSFERDPNYHWAGKTLRDPDLGGSEKMDQICDDMAFHLDDPPTDVPLSEVPD
jgi:hypothetical protein